MRIGIITQSLQGNYGGILQNYALQTVLKDMGHSPTTIDQLGIWIPNKWNDFIMNTKVFIYNFLYGKKKLYVSEFLSIRDKAIQNAKFFIDKYIVTTPKCWEKTDFQKQAEINNFEAYIVGSDQVWRPRYAPNIETSFLDFAQGYKVKRIAYAASFGVDTWEYTSKQTETCKKLLEHFDAISVREDSGIYLCREYLAANAIQVLDPTMLLDKEDYCKLLTSEHESTYGQIFSYILDMDESKKKYLNSIASSTGCDVFTVNQEEPFSFFIPQDDNKRCYPPIESWLKAFRDSKYVVCDSFHGAVFSIIFNKPFVLLKNNKRGNARFLSLLKQFHLEERLSDVKSAKEILFQPVDWSSVNHIRKQLKEESLNFLKKNLQ